MSHRPAPSGRLARRAFLLGTTSIVAAGAAPAPAQARQRPNILLILVDDMGWSDLGCFGGEIHTPNIDRLAAQGCLFSNFHVAPTCSPTRSMLLTGADNHVVGLGNMKELLADNQRGKPGYEGGLNGSAPTVATMLKDAGYHTYMAGKWHLGYSPAQLPANQGFEESVVLAEGGADNYEKKSYTPSYDKVHFYEGTREIDLPKDFYSTKFYTDRMLAYIDRHAGDGKPFFGYLAYQAMHQPHQAPPDYIARYMATYQPGWNATQQARYLRQQQSGLMPAGIQPTMPNGVPDWSAQSEADRRMDAKRMAIYAGMLEYLDMSVGRVVDHLKAKGLLDNTVILLMSDNGGEGTELMDNFAEYYKQNFDLSYDRLGGAGTYSEYGPGWAAVSSTPFSGLKGSTMEGGTRAPLIVRYPAAVRPGSRTGAYTYVQDIVPTILDFAGVAPPAQAASLLDGHSLLRLMRGGPAPRKATDAVVTELAGNIMVYRGGYKLVRNLKPVGDGAWHLYDLTRDPGEANDLADRQPGLVRDLQAVYADYVRRTGMTEVPADYNAYQQLARNRPQK